MTIDTTRDLVGRLLTSQELSAPTQPSTSFGWDANGNLASVTPPGKPIHSMTYTPVNLLNVYTPPAAGLSSYSTTYTPNGERKLATELRPDAVTIGRTFDSAGRVDLVTFGTEQLDVPAGTSGAGRVQAIIKGPYGVDVSYAYNGFLPTSESWTWSGVAAGSVTRTFDSNFRPSSETVTGVTGTGTTTFGYDNDGLLTCASPATCTLSDVDALRLTWDSNGLLTPIVHRNASEARAYSNYGELSGQTLSYTGQTPALASISYGQRDLLGRITQKTETFGGLSVTYTYAYNLRGYLTDVLVGSPPTVIEHYEYDSNGNRTLSTIGASSTSSTFDTQDRMSTFGAVSLTYGNNGETVNGRTGTYVYDALGNLLSVARPSLPLIEYVVDGRGRRIAKKVGGSVTKRWLYRDGLSPIAELDASGAIVARYIYGSRKNTPDLVIRDGNTYRIFTDHLGSPRYAVNTTNSSDVPYRADYSAYGIVTFGGTTAPDWLPFGFAGGLYDPDTGLVRFGARDYDPVLGRWTTKDPIRWEGGQANIFAYIDNDPVNRRDSSGLGGMCNNSSVSIRVKDESQNVSRYIPPGECDESIDGFYNPEDGGFVNTAAEASFRKVVDGTHVTIYDSIPRACGETPGLQWDFSDPVSPMIDVTYRWWKGDYWGGGWKDDAWLAYNRFPAR